MGRQRCFAVCQSIYRPCFRKLLPQENFSSGQHVNISLDPTQISAILKAEYRFKCCVKRVDFLIDFQNPLFREYAFK